MRTRRCFLFLLATVLGGAVVVLPAVAGSETGPTIEAVNSVYYEEHHWSPSQVTVSAGGLVTLSNPSGVKHGVEWLPGDPAKPGCTPGVPVGTTEAASATNWSGACTFTTPGTYTFYCTVHHAAMTGTIIVGASGATTTTSTTAAPGPSPVTTAPTGSGQSGSGPTLGSAGPLGSPPVGSASKALALASSQRGTTVRGSLEVSPTGAGGRLEVDLLARSASLARAGHPAQVRVGALVRKSLKAGRVSFSVPLNARARAALLRRHRLALNVKVVVKPAGGSAVAVTRAVVMHS